MRDYLNEEDSEISPAKRKKKKVDTEKSEQIRQYVDIKIGDFEEKIPESALEVVISFIRELLMSEMDTKSVIKLIMTDEKLSGKPDDEIELIERILHALDDKYDPTFINKIPASFPFLAAMGSNSYPLSGLDAQSLSLLNFQKGQTGRGEIAIPLLFGIDKFATDDDDEGKGTKTYDLVYDGKRADIKDYRNVVKGELKNSGLIRIGGPSSAAVRDLGDDLLSKNPIDMIKDLKVKNFTGMEEAANFIVSRFKSEIGGLPASKIEILSVRDLKKELFDAADGIIKDLDDAVQTVIKDKYDGGFFTIDETEIKIVQGDGFEFYACKPDGRIVIAPVASRKFEKGLKSSLEKKIPDIVSYVEKKTGKPVESGEIEISTPDAGISSGADALVETILRRLIQKF